MTGTSATVTTEPAGLMLDLQVASDAADLPGADALTRWAAAALHAAASQRTDAELTIRIVDAAEGAALNRGFRGRDGPTNVLSFPFEPPPGMPAGSGLDGLLGDLVLCAPVVAREAAEQHKDSDAHWAHLIVHGVLHLLGHDHIEAAAADDMEALETAIIIGLGFPPPYEVPTGLP